MNQTKTCLKPPKNPDENRLREPNDFRLCGSGHERLALAVMHVDFRTHAERFEIQPGFDGEAGAGKQPPIVMTLVVVHMHAVAMNLAPEAMPGTMQNPFPEPGLLEHLPCRPVDLPSPQVPLLAGRFLHERH